MQAWRGVSKRCARELRVEETKCRFFIYFVRPALRPSENLLLELFTFLGFEEYSNHPMFLERVPNLRSGQMS
jgi:hypothetical protein